MKEKQRYTPNKTTLIVFGIIVLAAIAYGIFYVKQNRSTDTEKNIKNLIDVALIDDTKEKDPRLIDTDGDGVYDWVEKLYPELDPNNPDSDGDGV